MAAKTHSIFDPAIIVPAIGASFQKLNPVHMVGNPVMFVTEVGALITTILLVLGGQGASFTFLLQITLWLWFTVLFANFAEAMAEGRGKAQAETLRKAKTETKANRFRDDGTLEQVPSDKLKKGDLVLVKAGEFIPGDGEIIEGAATVDESAITGESAPVVRESGGDRSAVTGGTRVLSDVIKIRITANPGETFLDRMIGLVEGAKRQKTPNEIALTILLSALTIIFLIVLISMKAFGIYNGVDFSITVLVALLVCLIPTTIGGLLSAIGIAGIDRLVQKNVLAMSGRAVEAGGRRRCAPARQDRHDHARQSPGCRVYARARCNQGSHGRSGATCFAGRRNSRRPQHRRAREGEIRIARTRAARSCRTPPSFRSPRKPA